MLASYAFPKDAQFNGVIPHPNAIRIAKFEFFWSLTNHLSPFGNEIAVLIFEDFTDWVEENPNKPVIQFINMVMQFWDLRLKDYNEAILEHDNILQLFDYDFYERVLIIDWSIIAIGFAELIIKGYIDENIKNIIHLAILRQMNSIVLDYFLEDNETFKHLRFIYLTHLLDILEDA